MPKHWTPPQLEGALGRTLRDLAPLINELLEGPFAPGSFEFRKVTLVTGLNKIPHGLGRAAEGFWNTSDTGAADLVHSRQAENPTPERTFWLHLTTLAETQVRLLLVTGIGEN